MHDGCILGQSQIFTRAEQGGILTIRPENVLGQQIGPYLADDIAYSVSPWFMKPFPEGTQDCGEMIFNKIIL